MFLLQKIRSELCPVDAARRMGQLVDLLLGPNMVFPIAAISP